MDRDSQMTVKLIQLKHQWNRKKRFHNFDSQLKKQKKRNYFLGKKEKSETKLKDLIALSTFP
jgi:hypothetical protein